MQLFGDQNQYFVSIYARGFHQLVAAVVQETSNNRGKWTNLQEVNGAIRADAIVTHPEAAIPEYMEPIFSAYHQFWQWEHNDSIRFEISSSIDCGEIRPDAFCGNLMRLLMFLIRRSHPSGLQVDVYVFSPL